MLTTESRLIRSFHMAQQHIPRQSTCHFPGSWDSLEYPAKQQRTCGWGLLSHLLKPTPRGNCQPQRVSVPANQLVPKMPKIKLASVPTSLWNLEQLRPHFHGALGAAAPSAGSAQTGLSLGVRLRQRFFSLRSRLWRKVNRRAGPSFSALTRTHLEATTRKASVIVYIYI